MPTLKFIRDSWIVEYDLNNEIGKLNNGEYLEKYLKVYKKQPKAEQKRRLEKISRILEKKIKIDPKQNLNKYVLKRSNDFL